MLSIYIYKFKVEILIQSSAEIEILLCNILPILPKKKRNDMSKEEKTKVSNNIPSWFNEILCGIMLSDGTIRMNGNYALLSIQQTHKELTEGAYALKNMF